jgi:hypothetical protein
MCSILRHLFAKLKNILAYANEVGINCNMQLQSEELQANRILLPISTTQWRQCIPALTYLRETIGQYRSLSYRYGRSMSCFSALLVLLPV